MTRSVPRSAALLAAIWVSAAAALGLGDIDVRSRLNQRFVAAIPLTAANAEDLESLKVSLASNAEFERAGVERPAYLSSLRFEIKTDGTPRIEITSDQPAREPFLTLLLDVRDGGNRIVREYTVFLDPPDYAAPIPADTPAAESEFYETATESTRRAQPPPAPSAAESAPATTQQAWPSAPPPPPPEPRVEPATPAPAPAPEAVAGRYGPIQPSETLWSVATRLRPDGVTMDQMLLALYSGNPAAFDGGINGLLKGATLEVPTAEEIAAVDPAAAREEIQRLRGAPRGARPAAEVAPAPLTPVRPAPIILPESRAETEFAPEPAPEPEPQLPSEPAAEPAAPAAAEPSPTPAPEAAPVEEPGIAADSTLQAPIEEPPATVAPEAPAPAAEEEIVVNEPVREPANKESGLLETLLLPLIGGLLVLSGIGLLISRILARRKSAGGGAAAAPTVSWSAGPSVVARPAAVAAAAATRRSAQDELEDLQATLDQAAQGETQRITPQGADTQQIKTQQLSTQQLSTPPAPSKAAPVPAAPAADSEAVDFDLTGQFESQTVQINLDANDPVSEADFHLAYGLYDEAALLLKQAADKEPNRADIRMKLAETYFAAGKPTEFQECAAAAKPMLSAADWQKLAIMGQQLAPDAPLFRDGGATVAAPAAAVDLDLGAAPAEPVAAAASPAAAAPDLGLEFNLDDLDVPKVEEPKLEIASGDKGDALEFDLTQFDLAAPNEAAPAAAGEARADAGDALDFDLDLGDFGTQTEKKPQTDRPEPPPVPQSVLGVDLADEVADVRLDDIDLGDMPIDGGLAPADEAGTKLDLARAYVDMGDNEMAHALLDEVVQQGNDQQKQEAQTLIARLA